MSNTVKLFELLKRAKHDVGRKWYGYYTPMEMLFLFKNGIQPVSQSTITIAKDYKSKGKSLLMQFEFYVNKKAKKLLEL